MAVGSLLALCCLSNAQQGVAELKGVSGVVRLTGFSNFSVRAGGDTVATAIGSAVKLEDTGNGITLTGKTMTVTLRRNAAGQTEVASADTSGGSEAFIDSAAAAKARQRTTSEDTKTHIVSERFSYSTSGEEGTLVVPGNLVYDSVTTGAGTRKDKAGVVLPTTYTQTLKLSGSSARLTIGLPAIRDEDAKPRTGRIEGPVPFDLTRNETASDGSETTHVYGKTDLFTADFVGQPDPLLTATGNVVVDGEGQGLDGDAQDFIGHVTGTQAVITLDRATLKPKLYEFSGEPAVTRVGPKESGR